MKGHNFQTYDSLSSRFEISPTMRDEKVTVSH